MAAMTMTLDNKTKQLLSKELEASVWGDGRSLSAVGRAINEIGAGSTMEDVAKQLKERFGKDSYECKFMDHFLGQLVSAKEAGVTDLRASAQNILRTTDFKSFTEETVGKGKEFPKTLDHILVRFFQEGGSPLITQTDIPDASFAAIQAMARGEALPEGKIDNLDRATWLEQYKDFVSAYKAAGTDGAFAQSKDVFLQMIKSRVHEVKMVGGRNNDALREQARDAIGRVDNISQGIEMPKLAGNAKPKATAAEGLEKPNKPPYRALALAMKMINQLAKMMCSSFQKTVGASGFYDGKTMAQFDTLIGFGERLMERGDNLLGFFNGEKRDIHGNVIAKVEIGMPPDKLADLYKELKIDVNDKPFDKLQKKCQENVEEVETALRFLGLYTKFSDWVEHNGVAKTEEQKQKDKEKDAKIVQHNCEFALHKLQEIDAKNGSNLHDTFKKKVEEAENEKALLDVLCDMDRIIQAYAAELEKNTGKLGEHKSGKGKKLANEVNRESLFNKVEIERLKKVGGGSPEAAEDIEYLTDRNQALAEVLGTRYSEDEVQSLDVNREATAQYLANMSQRIFSKLNGEKNENLSSGELKFIQKLYGIERAEKLVLAGNGDVPELAVQFLYEIFTSPQKREALIGKFAAGKEAAYKGDGTPPRKGQTMKKNDAAMMQRLGNVFVNKSDEDGLLDSSSEVKKMAGEFDKIDMAYIKELHAEDERKR